MFRPWEKYSDIASVAASATGTADLPISGTYYGIYLRCLDAGAAVSVANIKADILNVKLTIDGVTLLEADAHCLYDLWEHYYGSRGASQQAGMLPIPLAPDWWADRARADALGWGMRNSKSFQLELTFNSAITIDQVQVYTERSPDNRALGEHRRLLKFARSFPSSGVQEVSELPTEGGKSVLTTAWHWQYDGSAAVIDNLEALVNNQQVINIPPLVAETRVEKGGRTWMVGGAAKDLFSLPFDLSADPSGYLSHGGLYDLRFRLDWSAAPNSHTLYRESIHNAGSENK